MNVLLLRPDKAGDAIKTLPALRLAVRNFPATWTVVTSSHNASLFIHEPGIQVITLPQSWESSPPEWDLPRQDIAINLLCDEFPVVETLLTRIPSEKRFSCHPKEGVSRLQLKQGSPQNQNESLNITEILEKSLGLELNKDELKNLRAPVLTESDYTEAKKAIPETKDTLGLCLFAGNTSRTHPFRHWISLIRFLENHGKKKKIYLFGAPSDLPKLKELKSHSKTPELFDCLIPSSFRTLGAYLKQLEGVIAVDSGPLHLALALGVPALGILSGGDFGRWFSWSSPTDLLIPKGIFLRHPQPWEVRKAYKQWISKRQ